MTSWNPEEDEQATEQPTEFKIKARLVLEGSDQHEWGVVKDCHLNINHIPEDAEIVGTWNKYGEGVFWISLTTSIEALVDRVTQLTAELAESRKKELESIALQPKTGKKRTSKPKVIEPEPEPEPDPLFASLRSKLGR